MKRSYFLSAGAVVVVVLLAGWLWWAKVWQNPNRVFWDMLSNNLATSGVTRTISQKSQGLSVEQDTQISFGAQPTAHALTTFTQNGGNIVTEEISNNTSDFVRYKRIVTPKTVAGKPLDVSGIVGKWAKLDANSSLGSTVTSGLFDQSLIGVLPMANLSAANRAKLLDEMHTDGVFSFDAKKVKTVSLNGRKTYQYTVNIKASAYVALMQNFEKLVGSKQYASLDPNSYAAGTTVPVTLSVDVRSHQLSQLYQPSAGRTEQYKAFGVVDATPLPHATLTTTELTKRLSALGQ